MEKENNGAHDQHHKMCDWCGNEYGRKYSWLRLLVAILIGLFIFSAGYHLGELNVLVHSQYGTQSTTMRTMQGRMWNNDDATMIRTQYNQDGTGPTTLITPAVPVNPAQ